MPERKAAIIAFNAVAQDSRLTNLQIGRDVSVSLKRHFTSPLGAVSLKLLAMNDFHE